MYNHGDFQVAFHTVLVFALTTARQTHVLPCVYHCFSAENQNAEFMSIELNGAKY